MKNLTWCRVQTGFLFQRIFFERFISKNPCNIGFDKSWVSLHFHSDYCLCNLQVLMLLMLCAMFKKAIIGQFPISMIALLSCRLKGKKHHNGKHNFQEQLLGVSRLLSQVWFLCLNALIMMSFYIYEYRVIPPHSSILAANVTTFCCRWLNQY